MVRPFDRLEPRWNGITGITAVVVGRTFGFRVPAAIYEKQPFVKMGIRENTDDAAPDDLHLVITVSPAIPGFVRLALRSVQTQNQSGDCIEIDAQSNDLLPRFPSR